MKELIIDAKEHFSTGYPCISNSVPFNVEGRDLIELRGSMTFGYDCQIHQVYEAPVRFCDGLMSANSIGAFSFFGKNLSAKFIDKIGRFCSIGENVTIGFHNNSTSMLATSPLFYFPESQFQDFHDWKNNDNFVNQNRYQYEKNVTKFKEKITIGNDVFIGANVCILNGVTIGHGAVIATGAVVNNNIPPYTIVAGVPAKTVKQRFSNSVIEELLSIEWWNYSITLLKDIDMSNPEKFIPVLRNRILSATPVIYDTVTLDAENNNFIFNIYELVDPIVKKAIKNNKFNYIDQKTVLFRNELDNSSQETLFRGVGQNTGNQVFTSSIKKLFQPQVQGYHNFIKCTNIDTQTVITTDLIWINQNSNFDYLHEQMETLKETKFVAMSVGLQAPEIGDSFSLNKSTLNVLKEMESRSVLGVRGEYTASVLEKHGIRNYRIIGCPSLYYWNTPDFNLLKSPTVPSKLLSNFRTFYGELSVKEKHFLSFCADQKATFVEQTSHYLEPNHTKDMNYFNYVSKWLENNTLLKFTTEEWLEAIRGYDFSIGGRFHGNVIALWENIPSLFLTVDSRTKEMVDFFKLPSLPMNEFDRTKPLEYYYNLADYSEFNKIYKSRYLNFLDFCKINNLSIPFQEQGALSDKLTNSLVFY